MMKPEQWKQIESLCHRALTLHPNKHAGFLDAVCGDDAELRREGESLLKQVSHGGDLLERPTEELAKLVDDLIAPTVAAGTKIGAYEIQASSDRAEWVRSIVRTIHGDTGPRPSSACLRESE